METIKILKRFGSVILFLLLSIASYSQQTYDEQVESYINQYKDVAIEEMQRTGIPASITLGQGIIESGAGNSALATEANNHFGIKCHSDWTGETFIYDDDRRNECFRKYNSALDSYHDHSDFLKNRSRYAVLFTYDPMDYRSWAKGLKSCGYATNPQYANILIRCIDDNDLHQWDLNEKDRSKWFAQLNNSDAVQPNAPEKKENELQSPPYSELPQNRIAVFNDTKCVTLQSGESLNDLATDFEISMSRLLRYNDITDVLQIGEGDRIYLQPKRHNGDQDFHTVQPGETMFAISMIHGIQLRELYEKNVMVQGTQPLPGEVLFLRSNRNDTPKVVDSLSSKINPAQTEVAVNASYQYHTVTAGDTLYNLSKKYDVPLEEIKEMNKLYSDHLFVGQRLRIAKDN